MYVFNAARLSKQHAVEHLDADLSSYGVDVAIVTETHRDAKHADKIVSVPGYTLYRRDRSTWNASGRLTKYGGVAVYVRSSLQSAVWKYSYDDTTFELLWVRCGGMFIGSLYNPAKPQYQPQALVSYVDGCVQELMHDFPTAEIVIAGDFNKLPETSVVATTGRTQIVRQPARGANVLDQIYVSGPLVFDAIRVIKSGVKSDHLAVVAFTERCIESSQPVRLPEQATDALLRVNTLPSYSTSKTSISLVYLLKIPRQHSTTSTTSHSDCWISFTHRKQSLSSLVIWNTSRHSSSRCCARISLCELAASRKRVSSRDGLARRL